MIIEPILKPLQTLMFWVYYLFLNIEIVVLAFTLFLTALILLRQWRASRWIACVSGLYVFVIFISPLVPRFAADLEYQFTDPVSHQVNKPTPEEIKGFILLGGSFNRPAMAAGGPIIYTSLAGRLPDFLNLIKDYPSALIILSGGGKVAPGIPSEAQITKDLLLASGISQSRIILEDQSRTTEENARFSKQIISKLQSNASGQKWALVTSAIHMRRAKVWFDAYKVPVIPVPVDFHLSKSALEAHYNTLLFTARTVKEWRLAMYETAGYLQAKLTQWSRKQLR